MVATSFARLRVLCGHPSGPRPDRDTRSRSENDVGQAHVVPKIGQSALAERDLLDLGTLRSPPRTVRCTEISGHLVGLAVIAPPHQMLGYRLSITH